MVRDIVPYGTRAVGRYANEGVLQHYYRRYTQARDLYNQIQPYASRAVGAFRNSTFYGTRGGPNLRGTFNKYAMVSPSGYRRNSMPRRGTNRLISRKRPGTSRGRRRLRYGTRVRKQALGLFEGWKHMEPNRSTTPIGGVVTRTRLLDDLRGSIVAKAGGSRSSEAFTGRSIFLRGVKINFLLNNSDATNPVDVRFVFGWRKMPYMNPAVTPGTPDVPVVTGDDAFAIFKNNITGAGQAQLADTDYGLAYLNQPWNLVKATIDKKVLHVEKDFVVRLGPADATGGLEQVFGSNLKKFSIWWELNNKKWGVKDYTEADAAMTTEAREFRAYWYPVVYYWHVDAFSSGQGHTVSFNKSWTIYFKDPLG